MPLAARAQQPGAAGNQSRRLVRALHYVATFRKGLNETGYVEGQNVAVEYHYLEGHYDRLPALMADLVRRRMAVIATPGLTQAAIAAKAATARAARAGALGETIVAASRTPNMEQEGRGMLAQVLLNRTLG